MTASPLTKNPTSPPARRQTAASASRVAAVWRGLRLTLGVSGTTTLIAGTTMSLNLEQNDLYTKKEEFALLVEYVTDMHKSFVESTTKVTGFLLLALGWFATAESARQYLRENENFAVLSAIAVAATYALSLGASLISFRSSRRAMNRLAVTSYLPPSAYEGRPLGLATFLVCIVGNGVLAVLLIAALLAA